VRIRILKTPLLKISIPVIYLYSCHLCLNSRVSQVIRRMTTIRKVVGSRRWMSHFFYLKIFINFNYFFLPLQCKVNFKTFNFKILLYMHAIPFSSSNFSSVNIYIRKGRNIESTCEVRKKNVSIVPRTANCFVVTDI
jgi:hypothetical protein